MTEHLDWKYLCKQIFVVFLALVFCIWMLPTSAFAANLDSESGNSNHPSMYCNDDDDDDDDDESANGDDKGQAQAHKEPTKPAAKKPAAKKPNKTSKPSKKADKSDKSKSAVPKKVNGNGSTPKDFDSD